IKSTLNRSKLHQLTTNILLKQLIYLHPIEQTPSSSGKNSRLALLFQTRSDNDLNTYVAIM
ncbi:hypothetical protein L1D54_24420, partial [Vibrio brasiliensis]|uniref:hypothetical protein n=1 Tax=Vibrio brasiliensis TaxID=170652 RepID=UPI001EFD2F32